MPRPKMKPDQRRSSPVYVLLRPDERAALEAIREDSGQSRGAILREAFNAARDGKWPVWAKKKTESVGGRGEFTPGT